MGPNSRGFPMGPISRMGHLQVPALEKVFYGPHL